MSSFSEVKEKLITACRILDREGILDELGHFSVRCPEKDGVLVNGSVSPGQAREKDLIVLDLDLTAFSLITFGVSIRLQGLLWKPQIDRGCSYRQS